MSCSYCVGVRNLPSFGGCSCDRQRSDDGTTKKRSTDKNRRASLKRYGLSESDYAWMLEAQTGRCAICRQAETAKNADGTTQRLSVDHCHPCGHVRGLLCHACNKSIGLLGDSPERLAAAIAYLRPHHTIAHQPEV
jgi:Autographiviridae endonuclease VII